MSDPRRDTGPAPLPDGLTPPAPSAAAQAVAGEGARLHDAPSAHGSGAAPQAGAGAATATANANANATATATGAASDAPHTTDTPNTPFQPDVGWLGDLQGLAQAARGMFQSRALLLVLELERARHGLINLMVLLVVAAIAGATAWFALWAGLIALAVHLGLALPWACAGVLVINLLLLGWVASAMKSLAPLMSLPASRRQFHWLFNDPRDQEDTATDGRPAAPSA